MNRILEIFVELHMFKSFFGLCNFLQFDTRPRRFWIEKSAITEGLACAQVSTNGECGISMIGHGVGKSRPVVWWGLWCYTREGFFEAQQQR
ncbi:hypothetical protein BC936DRAFT_140600 [Jimgerdemannia flammicorona]|uniref:Uncharacterized protein n=1 Tax=Jimgerdemannia flammicorona TaxID=994334 RepID=A0A433AKJ9_9FUNG|nr:hypothetical protein BC936DRAFT_140600 [Jimgerdemannia flammicorona]